MEIPYDNPNEPIPAELKRPVKRYGFKWTSPRETYRLTGNWWRNQSAAEEEWMKRFKRGLNPSPIKVEYIEEFLYQ